MSRRQATGRHRSAGPAKTPLTGLATAVTNNASSVGRRSAVLAASSGLAMTMGIPAANATGANNGESKNVTIVIPTDSAAPKAIQGSGKVAEITIPVEAPQPTASVAVPADAEVDVKGATVTAVTPPAAPEVVVERAPERPARSAPRPAAPATPAPEAAKPAPAKEKPAAPVSNSKKRAAVLSIAARYIGVPYRWGGTTPKGFDCSGYVQYVYRQVGINLPRTSGAQAKAGRRIPASKARPGDLVWKPGHIGIYAGNGMMYHAPRSGKNIEKRKLYFTPVYIRVID